MGGQLALWETASALLVPLTVAVGGVLGCQGVDGSRLAALGHFQIRTGAAGSQLMKPGAGGRLKPRNDDQGIARVER